MYPQPHCSSESRIPRGSASRISLCWQLRYRACRGAVDRLGLRAMNEATNLFKRSSRSRTHSNAFGITIDAANMKDSDATNRMMQHPTAEAIQVLRASQKVLLEPRYWSAYPTNDLRRMQSISVAHSAQQLSFDTSFVNDSATIFSASAIVG
jgi:hypothetical protein